MGIIIVTGLVSTLEIFKPSQNGDLDNFMAAKRCFVAVTDVHL